MCIRWQKTNPFQFTARLTLQRHLHYSFQPWLWKTFVMHSRVFIFWILLWNPLKGCPILDLYQNMSDSLEEENDFHVYTGWRQVRRKSPDLLENGENSKNKRQIVRPSAFTFFQCINRPKITLATLNCQVGCDAKFRSDGEIWLEKCLWTNPFRRNDKERWNDKEIFLPSISQETRCRSLPWMQFLREMLANSLIFFMLGS